MPKEIIQATYQCSCMVLYILPGEAWEVIWEKGILVLFFLLFFYLGGHGFINYEHYSWEK